MIKKDILIGFFIGILTNSLGVFMICVIITKQSIFHNEIFRVFNASITENFIGKLISLGAILNLICFFYFLKKNNDSKAAGVLIATLFAAFFTLLIKFK